MQAPHLPSPRVPTHSWFKERTLLLRRFWEKGTSVATLWPSSQRLARMMVDRINFKTASSIVELGVGTGPITAAVAKRLHPDCRYLGVELDEELHAYAKKRFPQMNIVLADAADLPQLMEEHDMPAADAILTGLPIPSIPKEPQRRILHGAAAVMKEGAPWLQITALGGFLQYYRNRFDEVIRHWVPHFPYPTGGFYECRGVRDQVVGSAPK